MTGAENNGKEISAIPLINYGVLLISGLGTVLVVGWVLWSVRFGIDFADESFYLIWISNPFKYSVSVSQFGYIYHPLYKLVDGDVAALRQANVLITFGLAWALTFVFLSVCIGRQVITLWSQVIASAAIATASLIFFRQWLPSPSYNSLTFQALMLSAIGLMLACRNLNLVSLLGWLLLGVGGWLAFMAKPTAAAALAVSSVIYLVASRKVNIVGLVLSILSSVLLVFVSALLIDGSFLLFCRRIIEGLKLAQIASPNYGINSVFRIDSFCLSRNEQLILILGAMGLCAYASLAKSSNRGTFFLWVALFLGATLAISWVVLGADQSVLEPGLWVHLIIWSVPLGSVIIGLWNWRFRGDLFDPSRSQWSLVLLFVLLPYAYAFGTGSNYWFYQGLASLFWILAGLVFLRPVNPSGPALPLLSVGIAVQLLSALIILVAVQYPYYQPAPLRNSNYEVDFGKSGSKLIVHETFGQYISDAVSQAEKAGFGRGAPMIDLTGRSPGVLYALGASSTGAAWIYGNYINSSNSADTLATEILASVECEELSRAWLLVEPEGPVRISPEILKSFGAELSMDYKVAGAFMTKLSVGGFPDVLSQILFKPIRPVGEAEASCKMAKEQRVKN